MNDAYYRWRVAAQRAELRRRRLELRLGRHQVRARLEDLEVDFRLPPALAWAAGIVGVMWSVGSYASGQLRGHYPTGNSCSPCACGAEILHMADPARVVNRHGCGPCYCGATWIHWPACGDDQPCRVRRSAGGGRPGSMRDVMGASRATPDPPPAAPSHGGRRSSPGPIIEMRQNRGGVWEAHGDAH